MAIKYELGESTGIYRQYWRRAIDTKSQIKLARAITRGSDIDWQLRDLERKARAILRKQNIALRRSPKFPLDAPSSADGMTRDAVHVLQQAFLVRDWLAEGNARCAALHALRLGSAVERMGVRPFEPFVKTGRGVKRGARLGGLARKQRPETYVAWQTAINELAALRPDLTFRALARIVGKKFNRKERQIRRHTKNPH